MLCVAYLLIFSHCLATSCIFITIIILILPYLISREIDNANIYLCNVHNSSEEYSSVAIYENIAYIHRIIDQLLENDEWIYESQI